MHIHEFEFVAVVFFLFGLYAVVKGRLKFQLVSGKSGVNRILDETSPKKVHKEIDMGPFATRVFGFVIIAFSTFIFFNFKGEIMFVI